MISNQSVAGRNTFERHRYISIDLICWHKGWLPTFSCTIKDPGGTQKRKWRITLMRHVRRLQRKSVSQGILSLGLHDVTSYVRYDGGFALTRAAVSSAMPRISSRAFLFLTIPIHTLESNFFDVVSCGTYQWPLIGGQILSRLNDSQLLSSGLSQFIACLKNVMPNSGIGSHTHLN